MKMYFDIAALTNAFMLLEEQNFITYPLNEA